MRLIVPGNVGRVPRVVRISTCVSALLIESLTFRSAGFARRFVQLPARSGHMPESLWATVVRLCMYSYRFIVYTYSCTWPLFDRRQARRSTVDAYAAWPSAHTGYARAPQRSRVVCSLPDHSRPQGTLLSWGPVSLSAAAFPRKMFLRRPQLSSNGSYGNFRPK